jgi:hypothetical protein
LEQILSKVVQETAADGVQFPDCQFAQFTHVTLPDLANGVPRLRNRGPRDAALTR